MEGLKNRKRRISSVPKLPDDDTEEIITTIPNLSMNNNDKSLPPLPLSKNNSNSTGNHSNNDNIVETNSTASKSTISLNTPIKSNPIVSTTPTNVNSLDNFKKNDNDNNNDINHNNSNGNGTNNENDGLSTNEIDNSDGVMNSIFRNITNYGTTNNPPQRSSSLKLDNENSSIKTEYDLGDGIKFENENGTEMLSYRRSRNKNSKPKINTDLFDNNNIANTTSTTTTTTTTTNNNKTHAKSKSLTTPIMTNQLKRDFSPIEGSITPNILNTTTPVSMTIPKTEIDYNLYVDEKYLDTQYRYATEKRNEEFHQIFTNIPETDRLLDDFSCALSREILLQGRIYISEHYLCFNSSLLGWVTTLVISLDEIQKFERRSTVGLFPNGIIIETKEAKHTFANFITRDQTLNFIETIWSKSISLSKKNHEKSRDFESLESKTSFENANEKNNVKLLTEKDLYTIDSDSSYDESEEEYDNEEDEEEEEEVGGDEDEDKNVENVLKNQIDEKTKINKEIEEITSIKSIEKTINKKKKNKSKDQNKKQLFPGPKFHNESKYSIDSTQTNIVLDKEYNIPIGLLYEIFFGKDKTFHQNMMIMNDGFNFTEYSTFNGVDSERSFEYDKKLNYPIGPKSTRVYCTERLTHYDLNDYIEILNISKTPNVPSGNAFDCRTKYSIIWGKENRSRLIISFKLEWSGTSWFKSIIESSALSGQTKAANDVNNELLKIIPSKIIEFNLNENEEEREIEEEEEIKEIEKLEQECKSINKRRKGIKGEDNIIKSIKDIIEKETNKFNDIKLLTRQRIEMPYGEYSISSLISFIILLILIGLLLVIKILFDNRRLSILITQQNVLIDELNNKVNELLK